MPSQTIAGTWLCAALVLIAGTMYGQEADKGLGEAVDRPEIERPSPEGVDAPVSAPTPESLKLEQKIAQLMLVTMGGVYQPDNDDRLLLKDFTPAGVVIPRVAAPSDAVDYITAIRALSMEKVYGIPLLIGTNAYSLTQHGLLPDRAFVQLPSMLSLAAAGDSKSTRRLADMVARYLKVMGFNMHLGPSLVLASPLAEVKGTIQVFGSDPEFVARAGVSLLSTFEEKGLVCVPMGFPGGGANRLKKGPAVLLTPRPLLATQDFLPYIRAIEEGAEILHVGNTLVPTLDAAGGPASLSPVVVRDVLRGELGFEGIVISGPVDAREVAERYGPAKAARLALEAGADLIYWKNAGSGVMKAIAGLTLAVRKGTLDEAMVNQAFERVIAFKKERGFIDRELPDAKEARNLERKKNKLEESYLVERRAITLVQNRGALLPLTKARSMPIGVTGVAGVDELQEALQEYIKPIAIQPIGTAKHVGRIYDFEVDRLTRNAKGMRTAICVFSDAIEARGQVEIVRAFHDIGARVVVILVGYPSLLPEFSDADAILLAYSTPAIVGQTMRAVADILVGNGPLEVLPALRDLSRGVGEELVLDAMQVLRSPVGRLPCAIDSHFIVGFSVPYYPTLALQRVEWDFGDGEHAKGAQTVHAYAEPGRYALTLKVTDGLEEISTGVFHVVVGEGGTEREEP